MYPIVCGVDRLQNTGPVIAENEVTAAIDEVMDREDVSAGVGSSTVTVAVQVNEVQCLFCTDEEFLAGRNCPKCNKGELG